MSEDSSESKRVILEKVVKWERLILNKILQKDEFNEILLKDRENVQISWEKSTLSHIPFILTRYLLNMFALIHMEIIEVVS